jgi:hypothetical protein
MSTGTILRFPKRTVVRVATEPASPFATWLWRTKAFFGEWLHKLGFPGPIRNLRLEDALTGQDIVIRVNSAFTRVTINGREHYYYHLVWCRLGSGGGEVHYLPVRVG